MSDKCPPFVRAGKSALFSCLAARLRSPLGRGLADQQLNVAHVESAAVQQFHKPQLQEDLQSPLNGADLLAGNGGYHLCGVGDILVKLQPARRVSAISEYSFKQDIGIQNAVLHTFQQHNGVARQNSFLSA